MINDTFLGFIEVDITPTYNIQTIGFNRKDNLSKGVLHRLFASISLWISNGDKCCLVTIDSIGFSTEESDILRDEIADILSISRSKVMLCFSHTHSAPNISVEKEYFHFLRNEVICGVKDAELNLTPIKAVWGNTEADIGINRRDEYGIVDKRIGILKVVDAMNDNLKLLILRVSAHGNVLLRDNYLISSDFIGVTRELLEEKFNCKVMITQGASGNIKPKYSGTLKALDKMATEIYNVVEACVDELIPQKVEKLYMTSETNTFYADLPSLQRAKEISGEAMKENNIDGTKWLKEINRLKNENIKQQKSDTEIQYFILNNGCFCGVPNEIMCEIAVDVMNKCNDELIYLGAYTNGCSGYLPTASEYDKGGYEVLHSYLIYYIYSGLVMPSNRNTAEKLVKKVSEKWNEIKI